MSEDQGKLLQAVTKLRNLIDRGKLVLVIGEGASILPQPATIDDWWTLFPNLQNENVADILITKEQSYLGKQQHGQSRFHSVLRALGKFPLIITTNLDELLERFLWNNGTDGEKMCLNQIAKLKNCWSNYHRGFIVKCFGDSGFQTRASESHKEYFYSLCEKQSCDENSKFIRQLFDECSVLFLGVDADHPLYQRFINKFAVSAKTTHYIFKQGESNERTFQQHGSLLKLTVDLEIWEFAQHLSSGKGIQNIDDIQHGKIYEISFLATQRESYLKQQLLLEQHATEIAYHTTNITNALTTDELLEKAFRPSLVNIYKKDPFGSFSDNTVDKCLEAMHKRKQHLIQAINNGIKVIAVFLYEEVLAEIDPAKQKDEEKRKMALRKHAQAILLCNTLLKTKSSLELLMVEGKEKDSTDTQRLKKETFAIIKLKGGIDEASCYAETATEGQKSVNVTTHLVVINGEEVARRRKIFDTSRERAWDCDRSVLKLTAAVLQYNKGVDAIDSEDLKRLKSLHDVHLIVDKDNIIPSKLEPLGKGQFGEVYKVVDGKGHTYALKVLKELDEADFNQLIDFRREVDTLRKASHPNIIKLDDVERQGNRLCLKLEFIDGCDLRKLIQPVDGKPKPQSNSFTLKCATQIGSALAHLHKLGIVHRDVKAENVLATKDQMTFKLGDFGLARTTRGTLSRKTMVGSMRYMAPEVKTTGGLNYSGKADIYSYGLMLIEVVSGNYIFANIEDAEMVYNQKESLVPPIPASCESSHGIAMKTVIELCLKPHRKRPSMDVILGTLISTGEPDAGVNLKTNSDADSVELVCLGTGKGTTAVLSGDPSSSFVIQVNGKRLLLVDVGLGVLKSYKEYIGELFPPNIFVTHNHSDHAAELPLGLTLFAAKLLEVQKGIRISILAGPEVITKLRDHRMDEVYSGISKKQLESFVQWTECREADRVYLDSDKVYCLQTFKSQHSETCYGFLLYSNGIPILGYTADSGYNEALYGNIFSATTVIIDARINGNAEHASFDEIIAYTEKIQEKKKYLISGYGTPEEWPQRKDMSHLKQMHQGAAYALWPFDKWDEEIRGSDKLAPEFQRYKKVEDAI